MKKNPWRGTSEDFGDFFVQHYYNFSACEIPSKVALLRGFSYSGGPREHIGNLEGEHVGNKEKWKNKNK